MVTRSNIFENNTVKSIGLSLVMGALGWAGHTLLQMPGTTEKLDQHTKQIDVLFQGQSKINDKLDVIGQSVGRIEGKIDQKNQDDRLARDRR